MSFPVKVALDGGEESLVITEVTIIDLSSHCIHEIPIDELYDLVGNTIHVDLKILSE